MEMQCPIEGCPRPRGLGGRRRLCEAHYAREHRYGDPLGLPPPRTLRSRDERFWEKVVKSNGCWRWSGSTGNYGYGQLRSGEDLERAHRISWELHFGPIPLGMQVLHHCDNPPCVRPDHLWLGTAKTNAEDRQSKGRQRRPPGDLRHVVPTKANGRWRPKGSRAIGDGL